VLPDLIAQAAPAVSDTTKLHQGEVVVKELPSKTKSKDSLPSVSAQIMISKPPSEVWKKIMQPERLMQREKKVKSIKVVSQTANSKDLAYTVEMSRLLPTFQYTLRHQPASGPMTLSFWRLNGSFRDVQGSWNVAPIDGGKNSVLTYNISIDPGPLIPRMLLQTVLKADLPNMMNNVKTTVSTP
jgi:carbon monoxide dehydrogenase subunit G